MDFVDYLAGMTPAEKQKLLSAQLLARKSSDNAEQIAAASRQAHSGDMLAAVAQMANNPGAAKAAQMMAEGRQAQHGPKVVGNTGFLLPGSGQFLDNPVYTGEKAAEREAKRDLQDSAAVAARERQNEALALRQTLAQMQLSQHQAQQALQATIAQDRTAAMREIAAGNQQNRLLVAALTAGLKGDANATKVDDRAQREIDRAIAPWVEKTGKAAIPDLIMSTTRLAKAIQEAEKSGKPVPGLGMTAGLTSKLPFGDAALKAIEGADGDAAIQNRTAMQAVINALLRKESGLAVTTNEYQRKQLELAVSPTASESTVRKVFKEHVIPLMRTAQANHLSALKPEALDAYRSRYIANDPNAFDWTQALPDMGTPPVGATTPVGPRTPALARPTAQVPGAAGRPPRAPGDYEAQYGGAR